MTEESFPILSPVPTRKLTLLNYFDVVMMGW